MISTGIGFSKDDTESISHKNKDQKVRLHKNENCREKNFKKSTKQKQVEKIFAVRTNR